MHRLRLFVALACLASAIAAPARARAEDKVSAEARRLYHQGTAAYNVSEFREAIEKFKAAYKLKPEPAFLYNIAQSYRKLGEYNQALFTYRSYLRSAPGAANRGEAEARIKEMEKLLAQGKTAPPPGDTATASQPSTEPAVTEPGKPAGAGAGAVTVAQADRPASRTLAAADVSKAPPPATDSPTLVTTSAATPSDASSPIYTRWWFWTGAGAIVAGAVIGTLILTAGPDRPDGATKVFCGNTPCMP